MCQKIFSYEIVIKIMFIAELTCDHLVNKKSESKCYYIYANMYKRKWIPPTICGIHLQFADSAYILVIPQQLILSIHLSQYVFFEFHKLIRIP